MPKPGFHFKEGKLYAFSESGVIILEGWPELKGLTKTRSMAWAEFEPIFRVVLPYRARRRKPMAVVQLELGIHEEAIIHSLAEQRRKAFDRFRFAMPKPVAAHVERYQSRQWGILKLMQKSDAAIELAGINSALCFALGNYTYFRKQYSHPGRPVLVAKKRQREIAGWLGFPDSEAVARILGKIVPESASIELLRPLRAKVQEPHITKILAHLPELNVGVLSIVMGERLLQSSNQALLEEIACCPSEKYRADAAQMLGDTLNMLKEVEGSAVIPKIQSLERLRIIHAEVSAKYLLKVTRNNMTLPPPPFAGTEDIVPIFSDEELREEGQRQNNCVATYAERIKTGTTSIFRVLKPERATLSIVKGNDGEWMIGELKCSSNRRASFSTRQAVQDWLDRNLLLIDFSDPGRMSSGEAHL